MLARAVVVAALASSLAALADVASTVLWLAPGPDRWRLAIVFLAVGFSIGTFAGFVATALDRLLARGIRRPSLRHAFLVALPLAALADTLFNGGKMRRLPGQMLLRPFTAALLVLTVSFALTRLRAFTASIPQRPPWQRRMVGGTVLALALTLHAIDHRVLPRLYEPLHVVLGIATALAFGLSLLALTPIARLSHARLRRMAVAFGLTGCLAGAWAWGALDRWPNVRAEAFGTHAPFVRHTVLAVATLAGAPEARPIDPVALRRARLARQSAPVDPTGAPTFPEAHVLLITIDAMRADRLGRRVEQRSLTPRLDALAAQGVVFANAYAQAPHSSYSLASLHTGEYLHETLPLGQRQPLPTLAQLLGSAGRHTVALYTQGVFFTEAERLTGYRDTNFGFARAVHVDRNADEQATAAMAELDDLARRGEPPGFLWVHFFDAHAPYQGDGATPVARYDHAVSRIDAAIGRLLDHARRTLARDLVVVVTADHGEEFGEHGGVYHGSALYDEQVRVPLLIVAPGMTPRRVLAPVELVDLAPTLAGLVGVARAPTMRGRDLRPWMLAPPEPGSDTPAVFSAVNTRKMVRHGQWKLIADLAYDVDELYDLTADPLERRNLAATWPDRRTALHAHLAAWLEALTDRGHARGAIARARIGDRSAAAALASLANDPRASPQTRSEAIELLEGFGDAALVAPLQGLLDAPQWEVRAAAAIALGRAGDSSAVPMLRDLVVMDPPALRRRAAMALARLAEPEAIEPLVEALWSRDETERLEAIRALGQLGDNAAVEALLTVFPDDHVRYRVVLALGQMRDPRLFDLLARTALHDPMDDARANAIAALGLLGDLRAVPLIASTVRVESCERYAVEALGALGVVGPEFDGFDARMATVVPEGFDACGPHEDTLGWRYLGARSCVAKPSGGRVTLPLFIREPGVRLLVLRARRDDGAPVRARVLLNGEHATTVTLSSRWEEVRFLAQVPAGDLAFTLDLSSAAQSPAQVWIDHVVSLPARR
jgi:arylsulfatase A-like enzyme